MEELKPELIKSKTPEKETILENNNKIQEYNDNLDLKKKESESEILDQKKEL